MLTVTYVKKIYLLIDNGRISRFFFFVYEHVDTTVMSPNLQPSSFPSAIIQIPLSSPEGESARRCRTAVAVPFFANYPTRTPTRSRDAAFW